MGNKHNKIESSEKVIYKYNILFIGENGVGTKTSLIKRIIKGEFVDIKKDDKEKSEHFTFEKDNKKIMLYLIDTNGEKDKRDLCKDFYKNADYIIMGFDCTNGSSFQEIIDYWYNVTEQEVKSFAKKNKIKFFLMSVKDNINIQNFINDLKMDIEKNISSNNINNGINEIIYGNPSKEKYKIMFFGDTAIGAKTSLRNVIINNIFDPNIMSTSGLDYSSKTIEYKNGKKITIDFWDTPGQERYKNMTHLIMKDTDCFFLGYSVTDKNTFENVKTYWYEKTKDKSRTDLMYLIGNKIDLYDYRQVEEDEALKFCEEKNIRYFETSCVNITGIQELLNDLADQLIKN